MYLSSIINQVHFFHKSYSEKANSIWQEQIQGTNTSKYYEYLDTIILYIKLFLSSIQISITASTFLVQKLLRESKQGETGTDKTACPAKY